MRYKTKGKRPAPWTPEENRAVCIVYHAMQQIQDMAPGAKFKAHVIRAAQGQPKPGDEDHTGDASAYAGRLSNRSKGSIEAKLMNVTAILEANPPLDQFSLAEGGYRPLANAQTALKVAVMDHFDPIGLVPRGTPGDKVRAHKPGAEDDERPFGVAKGVTFRGNVEQAYPATQAGGRAVWAVIRDGETLSTHPTEEDAWRAHEQLGSFGDVKEITA